MTRVAPRGWPDLHGFGDMVRGFEVRGDEYDEHEDEHEGNRYKRTHTHTPSGYSRGPESPTRKDTNVELLRRDQIASQMVEWKD